MKDFETVIIEMALIEMEYNNGFAKEKSFFQKVKSFFTKVLDIN